MKRLLVALACIGLIASGLTTSAGAGPSPGGYSSDNIEWLTTVPFNGPTATGANFFKSGGDHYMLVTGWHNFAIYDINDPEAPALVGNPVPFGFKFENEDVATNGSIMLFSETLPQGNLHVWDIEDKSNPVEIATVEGAGDHTTTCILDCQWAYGSEGTITDLRDPSNPKLLTEKWSDDQPPMGSTHDVTEVAPGIVLTSTNPMLLLDARKDPVHPKFLALTEEYEANGLPFHSNLWPNNMKDRYVIAGDETCCGAERRLTVGPLLIHEHGIGGITQVGDRPFAAIGPRAVEDALAGVVAGAHDRREQDGVRLVLDVPDVQVAVGKGLGEQHDAPVGGDVLVLELEPERHRIADQGRGLRVVDVVDREVVPARDDHVVVAAALEEVRTGGSRPVERHGGQPLEVVGRDPTRAGARVVGRDPSRAGARTRGGGEGHPGRHQPEAGKQREEFFHAIPPV